MSTARTATHTQASDAEAIPGLGTVDWADLGRQLDEHGYAMTPQLLSREQCTEVSAMFDDKRSLPQHRGDGSARFRRG